MKKLNFQILHLGSVLALLTGLLSSAAANADHIDISKRTDTCVSKDLLTPFCNTGPVKIDKGHLLHFGFVTKGAYTGGQFLSRLIITNNHNVVVITRRLGPNQALNSNMRVTGDRRTYVAEALLERAPMRWSLSSVAASLSYHPTNLRPPTPQDPTAGGLF